MLVASANIRISYLELRANYGRDTRKWVKSVGGSDGTKGLTNLGCAKGLGPCSRTKVVALFIG